MVSFGNSYKVSYMFVRSFLMKCISNLEPASLQKVAQQEEDEKVAKESVETIIEEIVNNQGQKQLVATVKPTLQTDEERTFKYDMMISYCHSDKDLTYKIHKFLLDQGFKVWIDLDNMYGPGKHVIY